MPSATSAFCLAISRNFSGVGLLVIIFGKITDIFPNFCERKISPSLALRSEIFARIFRSAVLKLSTRISSQASDSGVCKLALKRESLRQ